jgi:hypothetical protein
VASQRRVSQSSSAFHQVKAANAFPNQGLLHFINCFFT